MGATETTTYRVESVYALDDKASAALGNIEGAAGRASRGLGGVSSALGRLAAIGVGAFGMREAGRSLIGFNATAEDTKLQISGMLALAKKTNLSDEIARTDRLYATLQQRAAKLPGTTAEYADMLGMITQPITDAGAGTKDLLDLTVNSVVAAKALRVEAGAAARDIDQAIRGQYHSTDVFTGKLLGSLGYTGEAGRAKYNALSADKRMAELQRAIMQPQITQLAEAQGNSFNGVLSTLQDSFQQTLGKIGLPLFKAITAEVKSWNAWLAANQDKVDAFAKKMADGLVAGFRVVKDAVVFLVDHRDTLISIGKVWAAVKIAGGVADFAGGGSDLIKRLGAQVGAKGRDPTTGKFTKGGMGWGEAAGPVAGAALAGWEIGRYLDEQSGLSTLISKSIGNLTGRWDAEAEAAEQRDNAINAAHAELVAAIRSAAQRFAGKGGSIETQTSANLQGLADTRFNLGQRQVDYARQQADLLRSNQASGRYSEYYNVTAPLLGALGQLNLASASGLEGKNQMIAGMSDIGIAVAMRELTAAQRASIDVEAGTQRVMEELNRTFSAGGMPFLDPKKIRALLLGAEDPDAPGKRNRRNPGVKIGTVNVEVSAKDPDRWIHEAVTKALNKARRAPTRVPGAMSGVL